MRVVGAVFMGTPDDCLDVIVARPREAIMRFCRGWSACLEIFRAYEIEPKADTT